MILADLFRGNPGSYGLAKSKIDISIMSLHVVGPIVGASLSSISLRLPWAINTLTNLATIGIVYRCLTETLPLSQRVPFRLKGSNPLSFLTLFTRGTKLRMLAICHTCDFFLSGSGWEKPTHMYDEMHTRALFGWNLMQRGRYNSFRSLCSLPGSWVTGRLMRGIGPRALLLLGQCINMLESTLASVATQGWQFFALRPLGGFNQSTVRMAMDYTSSAIGKEIGVAQGQLQSALTNLGELCKITRPLIWGPIYARGIHNGWPGFFYAVSAATGVLQLVLMGILARTWDG